MDPTLYEYPSPLEGYENLEPLSDARAPDGKSLINPPATDLSPAYTAFPAPITNGIRGGFDIHIYFVAAQLPFARALHERIRREFPELRIYAIKETPVGPHPVGMFEVNVFTPAQFGAFVSWLVIARGPLSALVHPNSGLAEQERDHTQRATWMGQPYPLQTGMLREMDEKHRKEAKAAGGAVDGL